MKAPTMDDIREWKLIYDQYKEKLKPNRKTGLEVIEYLKANYCLKNEHADEIKQMVVSNIIYNKCLFGFIPEKDDLKPIAYTVLNENNGKHLYQRRARVYKGCQIIVGIELITGFVLVEGSDELLDDIVAFQGLSEYDLGNYYKVANYIRCLSKSNLLSKVLEETG